MRRVVYMMNVSADGYITAPAGGIDWSVPSDEVFRFHIQRIRGVDVHLLGRKLYETMLYLGDGGRPARPLRRRAGVDPPLERTPQGGVLEDAQHGHTERPARHRQPGG